MKAWPETEGERDMIDAAFRAVDALGGTFDKWDPYQCGYDDALMAAAKALDELGGMDPGERARFRALRAA